MPVCLLVFLFFFLFFCIFRVDVEAKEENKAEQGEKFWEVLMSAEKKDYESICVQYGVTDFRGMLKKLNEKKIEREKEQEKVFFHIHFKENKTYRIKINNLKQQGLRFF